MRKYDIGYPHLAVQIGQSERSSVLIGELKRLYRNMEPIFAIAAGSREDGK
jgi:hypothetical protein